MDAQQRLHVLREKWEGCTKCTLSKLRRGPHLVFGSGPHDADYLLVVDAPSAEDVEDGAVLSGEGGLLVEGMLQRAGIDPYKDLFRTSLVACRPFVVLPATDDTPARDQNRGPDKTEIAACAPRFEEIVYLVDPRIIIAMGDDAWKTLVSTKARGPHRSITSAAGELFEAWFPGRLRSVRYPVLATVSPSQLIANPSTAAHGPIATTLEAFMKISTYVQRLKADEKA